MGQHAPARQMLDLALALARQAAQADAGNRAGQQRIDALEVTSVQLRLAAGEPGPARAEAQALLERLPGGKATSFADARWRAEALLWGARAWRAEQARRALALAQDAAVLTQPARTGDDNATRRWLWAQALGEQALALEQLGEGQAATQAARAALAAWQEAPPSYGAPPALAGWMAPLRPLAAR
jgi:hypothetical protein